jgi:hypothetical protein
MKHTGNIFHSNMLKTSKAVIIVYAKKMFSILNVLSASRK